LLNAITTALITIKNLLLLDFHASWEPSLTVSQPVLHHHDVSSWNQLVAELRFVASVEKI